MERRRLAVICSHLHPAIDPGRSVLKRLGSFESSGVSTSGCHGGSEEGREEGVGEKPCVFCMIIRGESPAVKLYEDDVCLCILDTNPLSNGHSLIIPKSHFPSLEATPSPVVAAMCSKVPFLSNAIMKATHCDSFNLIVNSGSAAGQVIFHTHFHIIPRKVGDRLWPSESFRRQPIKWNQETAILVNCIRGQLSPPSDDRCTADEFILPKHSQD